MAKNAHLVLDERATIEVRLRERASFTEIGRKLGKDPSTIYKEVRLYTGFLSTHAASEAPVMNTAQHAQSVGNSIQIATSVVLMLIAMSTAGSLRHLSVAGWGNHYMSVTDVIKDSHASWRNMFILQNQLQKHMRQHALKVVREKASEISSTGNATVVTLNTVVVQKFVFVWNNSSENWVYSLSANRMNAYQTVTLALNIKGKAVNKSLDFEPYDIRGDYDNAKAIANQHSNGFEAVRCIDSYVAYSSSKNINQIKMDILTPRFVAHMLY